MMEIKPGGFGIGVIVLNLGATLFPLNNDTETDLAVKGVCSLRPADQALGLLAPWAIDFYTNDYRELVARDDIDVVAVFSPDNLHFEHCRAALEAGKHVVCTKPVTSGSEQAVELAKMAEQRSLRFLVSQTFRFERQSLELKEMFDRQRLGRILFSEASYIHDIRSMYERTPWRLQKQWMVGAGCHPVDASMWFRGEVQEVHAFAASGGLSAYRGEDNYVVNLLFADGGIGRVLILMGCTHAPEPMQKLALYGEGGTAVVTQTDNEAGTLEYILDEGGVKGGTVRHTYPAERGVDIYGHAETERRCFRYFERCLLGDREPEPNARDGAKVMIVIEAVLQSVLEKRSVRVDYSKLE
jgi:predicted dehydrogenase